MFFLCLQSCTNTLTMFCLVSPCGCNSPFLAENNSFHLESAFTSIFSFEPPNHPAVGPQGVCVSEQPYPAALQKCQDWRSTVMMPMCHPSHLGKAIYYLMRRSEPPPHMSASIYLGCFCCCAFSAEQKQ